MPSQRLPEIPDYINSGEIRQVFEVGVKSLRPGDIWIYRPNKRKATQIRRYILGLVQDGQSTVITFKQPHPRMRGFYLTPDTCTYSGQELFTISREKFDEAN